MAKYSTAHETADGPGLVVACEQGQFLAAGIRDLAGNLRHDVYQVRLFACEGRVEVEVCVSDGNGGAEVKRITGADVSFSLSVEGL